MSVTGGASITGKLPSLHYAIHHPHVFVLCPRTLSFALIPLSFTLERPMSVAPHHLSWPFDSHCGHPTWVPRGQGMSWNTCWGHGECDGGCGGLSDCMEHAVGARKHKRDEDKQHPDDLQCISDPIHEQA